MPPPQDKSQRFVVAVDFGTTYSGVAFAFSGTPEAVEVITQWPSGSNRTSDKVPSEILYLDEVPGRLPADQRKHQWGYEINLDSKNTPEPLRWFKLLLHDQNPVGGGQEGSVNMPQFGGAARQSASAFLTPAALSAMFGDLAFTAHDSVSESRAKTNPATKTALQLRKLNISPVDVVTDYLRSLRQHILSILELRFQREFVKNTRIEYILTVPAVWSDSAKNLTLQAARDAGFGEHEVDFHLIGEPEAAASYTLTAIRPNKLNLGDTFVVCDAGGGTVDLVSYKIKTLDPLTVTESVVGSGDLCGSVFVNERFESYVRQVLGDKTVDKMRPRARREMLRTFEDKVKLKFSDSPNIESFEVSMHGCADNEAAGLEGGFLTLTRANVRAIFEPIIQRILELVEGQVSEVRQKNGTVAAILLVGGFGSSSYLLKRLKEKSFNGSLIEVLQPQNAWSAIIRGALQRGLEGNMVSERKARRNYGAAAWMIYEQGKGWEPYKKWEPIEQCWKVPNRMTWYVKKGRVVNEGETISFPFYRMVSLAPGSLDITLSDDILACEHDRVPSWNNPEVVYTVCTLKTELSALPAHKFEVFTSKNGNRYWKINYHLEMKILSGGFTFTLMFAGKSCGKVAAKFY